MTEATIRRIIHRHLDELSEEIPDVSAVCVLVVPFAEPGVDGYHVIGRDRSSDQHGEGALRHIMAKIASDATELEEIRVDFPVEPLATPNRRF